jgi:cyclophilin family peptidyl-prolyl cis-trans isomerase
MAKAHLAFGKVSKKYQTVGTVPKFRKTKKYHTVRTVPKSKKTKKYHCRNSSKIQ